jgi:hypothetical protein
MFIKDEFRRILCLFQHSIRISEYNMNLFLDIRLILKWNMTKELHSILIDA